MHVGFHYHIPAFYKGNRIYTKGFLGRFIDSVAMHCSSLTLFLHTPAPHELEYMDYELKMDNVRLIGIGPHEFIPRRILRFAFTKNRLSLLVKELKLDIILIRGPSPLLPQIAQLFDDGPTAFLIVGDYLLGIDDLPQPRWRKELIRIWSASNKKSQMTTLQSGLTIVNSQKLYDEFYPLLPNLLQTRTSTLSAEDFYVREDTCLSPPYRLLYTGRINQAKGLLDMVRALGLLVQSGTDVVLDLVGWPARGDSILSEIEALAREQGVADRVSYLGYKTVGPELFACYKAADIYMLASLTSFEGFPRTIWEAMAHSMPVIATQVGSIPDFIKDQALLIEPAQPQALADAVSRLISTPTLRQELIASGHNLAREMTLEAQNSKMMSEIEQWVANHAKQVP